MTPTFETEKDLNNELKVIEKIAKGNAFRKLGKYELDYEIAGKAYIEVKCYNRPYDKYNNIAISLIKLVKMQEYSRKKATYLFIQFEDELLYINVHDVQGNVKMGGRKVPRGGSVNDRELMCYVPVTKFKRYE